MLFIYPLNISPQTTEPASVINYLLLGVLLLFSAFASGSESAFFSLGPKEKEDLKQEESRAANLVLDLLTKPKELLAILLILLNFVNIGVVIITANILDSFQFSSETVKFLVEIFGITFMILLIGEVVPKIYSTKNAIRTSKLVAYPTFLLMRIPPMSWLMHMMVKGSKLLQKRAKKKGIKITSDDLEQAIALTREEHVSEDEHKILEGIVKFGNTEACQIMRPRMEISALDRTDDFSVTLATILESGYSRMPVFADTVDNVIGILYIKDLLPHLHEDTGFGWTNLIRKPYFIPENKKIDDLLKEFQKMKMHMAIVVDEYGGASGLITLEDILEQIVGEISDEFDDDEIIYTKVNQHTYIFEGRTALVDFYKVVDIDGKELENVKGDSETIGGFLIEHAGRILKNNEHLTIEGIKFIVESSDKRRIKMIKVILPEEEAQ